MMEFNVARWLGLPDVFWIATPVAGTGGIPLGGNRRQAVNERLREIKTENALDIAIKKADHS